MRHAVRVLDLDATELVGRRVLVLTYKLVERLVHVVRDDDRGVRHVLNCAVSEPDAYVCVNTS